MQKIPHCPTCNNAFGSKDLSQQTSRLPLLLHCGHTVCEVCVTKLARSHHITLPCPICQCMSQLKSAGDIKSLMPDLYMLGIVTASRRVASDKDLPSLLSFTMVRKNSEGAGSSLLALKTPPAPEPCAECGECAATCRCSKCDVILCDHCFSKVHSSRSLKHHIAEPLSAKVLPPESSKIPLIPTQCAEHKQPIEYYCETDKTAICARCVIIGSHKEHAISIMEDRNKQAMQSMPLVLMDAKDTSKHLQHSLKVTQGILPEMRQEMTQTMEQIRQHFCKLHSALQTREQVLLEKVQSIYQTEAAPVEEIRANLCQMSTSLEATIKEADILFRSNSGNNMAQVVLAKLKEANNKPCLTKINSSSVPSAKPVLPTELEKSIADYGEVIALPKSRVELCTLDEAPQATLMAAIQAATPTESETGLTDCETASVTSSTAAASSGSHPNGTVHKQHKPHSKPITREEWMYVTHIRSPSHFVVQRQSEVDKLGILSNQINKYCKAGTEHPPESVEVGRIVLANYARDDNWYRARIKGIDTSQTPTSISIYYIDYGNNEVVTLNRLCEPLPQHLKLQEQAIICGLADLIPAQQGTPNWPKETINVFAELCEKVPLKMNVIKQEVNMFWVELRRPAVDDEMIKDDPEESIRDILVFREHAKYTQQARHIHNKSIKKREYLNMEQPHVRSDLAVMLSHVTSPAAFSVQKIAENAKYLSDMMDDMQKTYNQNTTGKLNIYRPQKGEICVALYSADEQWYRAQVMDLPGQQKVTVRYVDFGNVETILYTQLRKLLDIFNILPAQAIECCLAEIRPVDETHGWDEEAVKWFASVEQKGMMARVMAIEDGSGDKKGCLHLMLYNQNQECINQQLIDMGLAVGTGNSTNDMGSYRGKEELPDVKAILAPPPGSKHQKPASEHQKMYISHAETPSAIYIQKPDEEARAAIYQLQQELSELYTDSESEGYAWDKGDHCAVCYTHDDNWYRGRINTVSQDEEKGTLTYQVLLLDYGYSDKVSMSRLRHLEERFHNIPASALCCHLAGVQPAGCSSGTKWSSTANEFLSKTIKHKLCYVDPKGPVENESMPVDLLVENLIYGDALSADRVEHLSVTQLMKDNGLALPVRRTPKQSPRVAAVEVTLVEEKPAQEPERARASTNPSPPNQEICESFAQPSPLSSSSLSISSATSASEERVVDIRMRTPATPSPVDDTEEREEERKEVAEQVIDDMCESKEQSVSEELRDYIPGKLPKEKTFEVVAAYVDYEATIYVHETSEVHSLLLRENCLEVALQNYELESRGRVRAPMPKDGNCMFRCFAQAIFKDQSQHLQLRSQLVGEMRREWERYKNYIADNISKKDYLKDLATAATYGGEPEILALCNLYGVNTKVYDGSIDGKIMVHSYTCDGAENTSHIVELVYTAEELYDQGHYDLVLDANDSQLAEIQTSYDNWKEEHVKNTCSAVEGNLLQQLMTEITKKYANSEPSSTQRYEPGDPCVAWYPYDSLYYRAKVIKVLDGDINPRKLKVHYVDFGNNEDVSEDKLRPPCFMTIPIQCHPCKLYDVKPSGGALWSIVDLDTLHQLVVSSKAYVTVMEDACAPGDILPVSYVLNNDEGILNVNQLMQAQLIPLPPAQQVANMKLRSDKPTVVQNHGSYGVIPLVQSKRLRVCVTNVESYSQVYIQFTDQQLEANDPDLSFIPKDLQTLIQITDILNHEDTKLEKLTQKVVAGLQCVAPYSDDNCWYRAEVSDVDKDIATILFVDYGSAEYVSTSYLRELPAGLPVLAAQARRCTLVGMDQLTLDPDTANDVCLQLAEMFSQCKTVLAVVRSEAVDGRSDPVITLFDEAKMHEQGEGTMVIYVNLLRQYIPPDSPEKKPESMHVEEDVHHTPSPQQLTSVASEEAEVEDAAAASMDEEEADVVVEEELEEDDSDDDEEEEEDAESRKQRLSWAEQVNKSSDE